MCSIIAFFSPIRLIYLAEFGHACRYLTGDSISDSKLISQAANAKRSRPSVYYWSATLDIIDKFIV